MAKPEIIQDKSGSSKVFDYTLKNCNLRFTLRIDNTSELIPFKALLEKGLADVAAEVRRIQRSRVTKRKKK